VSPWDIDGRALELLDNIGFPLGGFPSGLSMLPESDELEVFGGDGSGGCFYLWHSQKRSVASDEWSFSVDRVPVVYLSSYGEASRFADDFTDALTIAVAFPGYWGAVLVAACKGLDLVGRIIPHYEADLEPDYAEARAELCELLSLDPASASAKLVAAVRVEPPFTPQLKSGNGTTPARSFAARSYPQ
jgi:hypothetical protein